jgi:hypothetical protein
MFVTASNVARACSIGMSGDSMGRLLKNEMTVCNCSLGMATSILSVCSNTPPIPWSCQTATGHSALRLSAKRSHEDALLCGLADAEADAIAQRDLQCRTNVIPRRAQHSRVRGVERTRRVEPIRSAKPVAACAAPLRVSRCRVPTRSHALLKNALFCVSPTQKPTPSHNAICSVGQMSSPVGRSTRGFGMSRGPDALDRFSPPNR